MANNQLQPDRSGYMRSKTGLIVPPGYAQQAVTSSTARNARLLRTAYSTVTADGFAHGIRLERDPDTLVVRWAAKGSGADDLINQAIADGNIANAGISPVLFSQLNGLMKRRQNLAFSTSIVVTGRSGPAARATNAIPRMDDSPLGAVGAIRHIIYQLDTFNRGSPIATAPIVYPTEQWADEAMTLIPLQHKGAPETRGLLHPDENAKPKKGDKYYLEVDWNIRKTPIPYLPNPLDLEPTFNNEWPYWYRTTVDDHDAWVLLHNSQILSLYPTHPGSGSVGTSSVWVCLGFLGEHVLAIDERYEALIDTPTNGLLTIGGITQTAHEVRNQIEFGDADEQRIIPEGGPEPLGAGPNPANAHDWTLITAPNEIYLNAFRFRQADNVDFEQRRMYFEDVLALAFDDTLQSIVLRGGVGYGSQAETASNNISEGGIFALLQAIETAFGTIYPRVTITVSKINDRARQLQLVLLDRFAAAMAKLPDGVFTIAEQRAIIDRDIMTIPATGLDQVQKDAAAGTGAENDDQSQSQTQEATDPAIAKSSTTKASTLQGQHIIDHLNTLIQEDLQEIAHLLAQMHALSPSALLNAALREAQQLAAQPLNLLPYPQTPIQHVLHRLRILQQAMTDL